VAGGGAQREILDWHPRSSDASFVTGNAATRCRLDFVQEEVRDFLGLARQAGIAVIDGTHYGTEKLPQLAMVQWFRKRGLRTEFVPDGPK
jgi:hypothetical protein